MCSTGVYGASVEERTTFPVDCEDSVSNCFLQNVKSRICRSTASGEVQLLHPPAVRIPELRDTFVLPEIDN